MSSGRVAFLLTLPVLFSAGASAPAQENPPKEKIRFPNFRSDTGSPGRQTLPANASILSMLALLFLVGVSASAQEAHPKDKVRFPDRPEATRYPEPPCSFAPEYHRIQSNKSDPRVAFMEIKLVITPGSEESDLYGLCAEVSGQTPDTVPLFDRAHGYMQLLTEGEPEVANEAIAYFSTPNDSGVMLYAEMFDTKFQSFVMAYRDKRWEDVTAQYLGPFHITKKDYIIVPQYGRTARVLTYDGDRYKHKLWLTWTGTKFEEAPGKPAGWRCPDGYRYFRAEDRAQLCQ